MRKILPFSFPRPVPSDMSNRSSTIWRNAIGVVPLRHHHGRQRRCCIPRDPRHTISRPQAFTAARVARAKRSWRAKTSVQPFVHEHRDRFAKAVEQVRRRRVGEEARPGCRAASAPNPSTRAACRADFDAASALSLIALKPSPGGSIRPFCEQPTVTSTPQSSWRYSIEPSDEIVSTSRSAGCRARIDLAADVGDAADDAGRRLVVDDGDRFDLMIGDRRRASRRRPPDRRRAASRPARSRPARPRRVAISLHSVAKWPVSNIRTLSPGDSVLTSDASHAPVPDAG